MASEELQRSQRLATHLSEHPKEFGNANAFLVSSISNIRYLTGFTGTAAYLLVAGTEQVLLSDSRYETQIAEQCSGFQVDIRSVGESPLAAVARVVKRLGVARLAVESQHLSKAAFDQLANELPAAELVSAIDQVEKMRAIKSPSEIEAIRKSIDVAERAFGNALSKFKPSDTERDFAFSLEHEIRQLGGEGFAFDPIVGAGERAALPHGSPTDRVLGAEEYFLVDWGANVDGYLSDLTRIVFLKSPAGKMAEIYPVVREAQQRAIQKIAPGVTAGEVDLAARQVIDDAGFRLYFGHGTGHSFGLEIHETPFLSPDSELILQEGMVLTVEPGIYLSGIAGVRLEEDVLVTKNGCEILSNLPKDPEHCMVRLGGI